jgi:hypothetical protein
MLSEPQVVQLFLGVAYVGSVEEPHTRDPSFTAMPSMDMRRTVIVGKDVNRRTTALGNEHPAHVQR